MGAQDQQGGEISEKFQIHWHIPLQGHGEVLDMVQGTRREREEQVEQLIENYRQRGVVWEGNPVKSQRRHYG